MADLVLRTALRADVPAIVAMLHDDEVSAARYPGHPVSEEIDAAYWAGFDAVDADPRNELVVAERGGELVGTMQLTFIPSMSRRGAERLQIEAVRVRSDLRGAGIGRAMMTWAVDQARERGCGLVQLTTDKQRTDAHRFYVSLGFQPSHEGMKLSL
ncbi:GNAT family N-acetyltransferase [Plantactinospora sp. S1510]|uniref:GNAT family N-acetyltransferase n=1 Tax=Plantactinospora alkalitolerans TaxID=2789879 RepID=A0ABS0GQV2_9ACTN|nr:GNAT family N-acetyltransferase [Plantactinospora alkalitolerans]MBF9128363.1 GNAT family N-acetyltransferase [Plantactinospora alkalitolerans]